MHCPKCSYEQDETHNECLKCGIIFHKYYKARERNSLSNSQARSGESKMGNIWRVLFYTKKEIDPLYFGGRTAVFVLLLIWGWKYIFSTIESNYANESFMHMINLPFHEAGHIFFSPFGSLMASLGGSLGQLLIPLICLVVLLLKTRDTFGASVALWWTGENFIDLAPYINDARSLTLPLLGGNVGNSSPYGFHDWEYILTETGLLACDHFFARLSFFTGSAIVIISLAWGGVLLYYQYKNLERWKQ